MPTKLELGPENSAPATPGGPTARIPSRPGEQWQQQKQVFGLALPSQPPAPLPAEGGPGADLELGGVGGAAWISLQDPSQMAVCFVLIGNSTDSVL